eukprot:gene10553-biopygen1770
MFPCASPTVPWAVFLRGGAEGALVPQDCNGKSGGGVGETGVPKVLQIRTISPGVGHMAQSTVKSPSWRV